MGVRVPAPDASLGADGLPILVLPEGTLLKQEYQLSYLAKGGMSLVYRAVRGGKTYLAKEVDSAKPNTILSLAHEKSLLERLDHPAIVKVHTMFEVNGFYYLILDFIEGRSMDLEVCSLPQETYLSESTLIDWALQLCDVLEYLHGLNPPVIYRDLKPGNIIRDPQGKLHLVDFGVARSFKPGHTRDTISMGTPLTASPEHYGKQTDERSDIFSLGATLHLFLSQGREISEIPFDFSPLRDIAPHISPSLVAVLGRCVEMKPERRFQSSTELKLALKRIQIGSPVTTELEPRASSQELSVLRPGTLIQGRYEIARKLRESISGLIWGARDKAQQGSPCSIEEVPLDAMSANRRVRADSLLQASHPGLARYFDRFETAEYEYLVAEFVAGKNLLQEMKSQPQGVPVRKAVEDLRQVLEAVSFLHRQDPPIASLDISPENLVRDSAGRLKLTNFGLVKAPLLSPGFSAPELTAGQPDTRTDIFALGATLIFMLTGEAPGPSTQSRLLELPGVNSGLADIIARCLQFRAEDLYSNAEELLDHLKTWIEPPIEIIEDIPDRVGRSQLLETGQLLAGRYKILRPVKRTGGTVYEASAADNPKAFCAIQEIRGSSEEIQQRAQTLIKLDHPGICKFFDFFEEGGSSYLVAEYCRGKSLLAELEAVQRRGHRGISEEKVLGDILELLKAVVDLHDCRPPIIHRAIKPANIIRDEKTGRLTLVNFELAPLAQVSGSLQAPEQATGRFDERGDVYSIGATIYFLINGKHPGTSFEPLELRPDNPPGLASIVRRCTEPRASSRYANARELAAQLKGLAKPVSPVVLAPPAGKFSGNKAWRIPAALFSLAALSGPAIVFLKLRPGAPVAPGTASPIAMVQTFSSTPSPSPSQPVSEPYRAPLELPHRPRPFAQPPVQHVPSPTARTHSLTTNPGTPRLTATPQAEIPHLDDPGAYPQKHAAASRESPAPLRESPPPVVTAVKVVVDQKALQEASRRPTDGKLDGAMMANFLNANPRLKENWSYQYQSMSLSGHTSHKFIYMLGPSKEGGYELHGQSGFVIKFVSQPPKGDYKALMDRLERARKNKSVS